MSESIPGLHYELKKTGEADNFIFNGVILPHGEFVAVPKVAPETVGKIKVKLILKPEQVSTNNAAYQEVASWSVSTKKGYLDALLFYSDTPATAQWKLTVNEDTIFTDKKIQNALNADIPELDLKEGDRIVIYVKSDGATTITADGCIQGREVGE